MFSKIPKFTKNSISDVTIEFSNDNSKKSNDSSKGINQESQNFNNSQDFSSSKEYSMILPQANLSSEQSSTGLNV